MTNTLIKWNDIAKTQPRQSLQMIIDNEACNEQNNLHYYGFKGKRILKDAMKLCSSFRGQLPAPSRYAFLLYVE